jgi:dTDP-4-dehydrorhamnose reductase
MPGGHVQEATAERGHSCPPQTAWITGAGGLIGGYVARSLSELLPKARIIQLTRSDLDLTDYEAVTCAFRRDQPDLVVHCAALTRTPECEVKPELARKLNVEVTAHLARLSAGRNFVFMSTDRVFDGRSSPYKERDAPNPTDVYGRTKAEAEQLVLADPAHLVIRTSLNGGTSPTGDRGFNEQMRQAWAQGTELALFTDEFRCPVHAEITAKAVCELALRGCAGIYHVAGSERLSRWDIGVLLAERWPGLNPRLRPVSLAEFKGPPRAPDLELDCEKAAAQLSFPLPRMSDWLRAHPAEEF